jgi:hypothetical protein
MQVTRAQRTKHGIHINVPADIRKTLKMLPGNLIGWQLLADGRVAIENLTTTLEAKRQQHTPQWTPENSHST